MSFDSELWWDEQGPFAMLHAWMPLRMRFILEQVHTHHDALLFPQSCRSGPALSGLNILDMGCGGGLVCQAMAKLGARVTGIDTAPGAIACAKKHQEQYANNFAKDLDITYVCADPLTWAPDAPLDVVVAFEVLEHVSDPFGLLTRALGWLKPGGLVLGSTLNRTVFAAVVGIGLAESILNWVPKGTHDWHLFLKPTELQDFFQNNQASQRPCCIQGCMYTPITGWQYSAFTGMNYFFSAQKNIESQPRTTKENP